MQKRDYQNLHNYVDCVILIYINKKKTTIVVEGGRMKERYKRALGVIIGILCLEISALISIAGSKAWNQALENMDRISYPHLSYEEWIAIHESEYPNSEDAQYAYHNYEEEYVTPEYREAQKKQTLYSVGEIVFFFIGAILLIRQIYLFRQYCLKRQPFRSPPVQNACAGGTADKSKSLQFFCANFVETLSKIGKSSNVSLQEKNGSEYIIIINKKQRGNEFGI